MGHILVAGAGIGGLAAALACARAGHRVQLLEQSGEFVEAGAGIQLGPNAVRRLHALGLERALEQVACWPDALELHSADGNHVLGRLGLGARMQSRYGFGYATVHRADLQRLLLAALRSRDDIALKLGATALSHEPAGEGIRLRGQDFSLDGAMLVGADGLWSVVRGQLLADGPPRRTGHIAYRALISVQDLPAGLAANAVHAWMGERMHAVAYPVSAGKRFNLVLVLQQSAADDQGAAPGQWNAPAQTGTVLQGVSGLRGLLPALLQAASAWRSWTLHDRPPVAGARAMAQGRVALLGDAAHPMRPYLAQGAVMALEDAAELGQQLQGCTDGAMPAALQRYAQARWQRVARVQRRSLRNGQIFHATGPLRWGRNATMALLGQRVLDLPWLYAG